MNERIRRYWLAPLVMSLTLALGLGLGLATAIPSRALASDFDASSASDLGLLGHARWAQLEDGSPVHYVEPLSAPEVRERTDFLVERLDARRKHATWWHRSWFAVYTGGMLFGSLRAGLADGEGERAENIVSAVKSTIGLSSLLLRPIEARHGADAVRAMPGESDEDVLRRLERGERQLEANAARAATARAWQAHLSSLALNLAGGAALLIVGSPERAAISMALGVVFGEISILTEPVTPAEDWKAYRARYESSAWSLVPIPGGLALQTTF